MSNSLPKTITNSNKRTIQQRYEDKLHEPCPDEQRRTEYARAVSGIARVFKTKNRFEALGATVAGITISGGCLAAFGTPAFGWAIWGCVQGALLWIVSKEQIRPENE